jgi:hypothetical protein
VPTSVSENARLASALGLFGELLLLDHTWTAAASNQVPLGSEDRAALKAVVDEMLDLIPRAVEAAHDAFEIIEAHGAAIDKATRQIAEAVPGEYRKDFLELLERPGGVVNLAQTGYDALAEQAGDAAADLHAQYEKLIDEGTAKADFGERFLCALAVCSVAAGVATAWIPPYVHGAAGLAAGLLVYEKVGCKKVPWRKKPAHA